MELDVSALARNRDNNVELTEEQKSYYEGLLNFLQIVDWAPEEEVHVRYLQLWDIILAGLAQKHGVPYPTNDEDSIQLVVTEFNSYGIQHDGDEEQIKQFYCRLIRGMARWKLFLERFSTYLPTDSEGKFFVPETLLPAICEVDQEQFQTAIDSVLAWEVNPLHEQSSTIN